MAQWIKTSEDFFRKICTSHFIVRVRKGLLWVLLWEGVRDRTELQYIDPHSYGRQHCVFLVLQGCSTGGPGAQLSAGWWLSLLHLITNWSPKLHRGSWGPLRLGVAFPTTSYLRRLWPATVWLPVLTELYNSSTPTQSPTQSLEWHIWPDWRSIYNIYNNLNELLNQRLEIHYVCRHRKAWLHSK